MPVLSNGSSVTLTQVILDYISIATPHSLHRVSVTRTFIVSYVAKKACPRGSSRATRKPAHILRVPSIQRPHPQPRGDRAVSVPSVTCSRDFRDGSRTVLIFLPTDGSAPETYGKGVRKWGLLLSWFNKSKWAPTGQERGLRFCLSLEGSHYFFMFLLPIQFFFSFFPLMRLILKLSNASSSTDDVSGSSRRLSCVGWSMFAMFSMPPVIFYS